MKRSEIEEKYKWDLSLIIKNDKQFELLLSEVNKQATSLVNMKGKLNNADDIVLFFEEEEKMSKKLDRAYLYSFLKKSEDGASSNSLKLYGKARDLSYNIGEMLSFVEPEISTLGEEKIDEISKDKRLNDYDRYFYSLKRNLPHILSEKEEKLLSNIGKFADFESTFDALDNIELKFRPVKMPDGTKQKLTNASFSVLQKHDDREVRKQAHINLHKGFAALNLTLSQNFINEVKSNDYFAKSYKFNSCLEDKLFGEEIDKNIYDNLISSVRNALPLFYDFAEEKRRLLNVEKINVYDMYATVVPSVSLNKNFEESLELIKKALEPMGKEYLNIIDRAKSERWIDVFPSDGKDSGAFSISCDTGNPFVMLNFSPSFAEISTAAHELGHAIHSFYSDSTQPYSKRDYVIFVAEVASTVNELMVDRYLLKTTKDQNLKNYIIDNILQKFYSTVFRQTMFSEFEEKIHGLVAAGKSVTFDTLNKTYSNLQHDYFGPNVEINKYAKYEWSRIPHFYRPFYVYKYATGFICAATISEKLTENKNDYYKKYKSFLSGGCSLDPVSLLKLAEVDISKKETFDEAFAFMKNLLDEYKKI